MRNWKVDHPPSSIRFYCAILKKLWYNPVYYGHLYLDITASNQGYNGSGIQNGRYCLHPWDRRSPSLPQSRNAQAFCLYLPSLEPWMARTIHGPQNSGHTAIFHVPKKDEGSNPSPLNDSLISVDQDLRNIGGRWDLISSKQAGIGCMCWSQGVSRPWPWEHLLERFMGGRSRIPCSRSDV